jgi:hypothetical protein
MQRYSETAALREQAKETANKWVKKFAEGVNVASTRPLSTNPDIAPDGQPDLFDEESESELMTIDIATELFQDGECSQAGMLLQAVGEALVKLDTYEADGQVQEAIIGALRAESHEVLKDMFSGGDTLIQPAKDVQWAEALSKLFRTILRALPE